MAEYQNEVHRLIAEIDSATDRDSMLVEDRINKLKTILEETDKRIAVYARELDRSRTGEALYTSLGRGIRAALNTHAEPPPQTPSIQTSAASNPPLTQYEDKPVESSQAESAPNSKRQLRIKIESMVNNGLTPAEIASNLKISIAEVDLAINLMNRSK
ncbi:MAG: hypothetical protein FWC03_07045 [Treponema sp.]|nr:hypothetical protein [Treponema sp.]